MEEIPFNHLEARVLMRPCPVNHGSQHGSVKSAALQGKERITVALPKTLVERLRNAVYWNENRTLAHLIADAVEDAVTEIELANGGAFPTRLRPLKPGRRRTPQPPPQVLRYPSTASPTS